MATSPIYNWPEPDNTDLVKNGALAIRTLGNAIDTTMATMTPKSLVDAKGDLIAATANDTPARLAVGANGETLVADSSTSTNLRYQTGVNLNCAINGAYDIWQRGTSSTGIGTAKTFLADRWFANSGGASTTFAYTQSTSVPTGFQYATKIQRTAANTGTNTIYFQQDIETKDSIPFAGQTVTISLYAKAGANFSSTSNALSINLVSGTGTDQSQYFAFLTGQANVATGTATLTTSYQRFTFTGTVSSSATQLGININYTPTGTAGADDSFFVTGVQVERGSVATTFKRAGGTIQGELAACTYYDYDAAAVGYLGTAVTTSILDFFIPMPVNRNANYVLTTTSLTVYSLAGGGAPNYNTGTFTIVTSGSKFVKLRYTHGSAVFTAGTAWELAGTKLNISMEL